MHKISLNIFGKLTEILGKGGLGGEAPSLEYILLCLNKVRKVRLGQLSLG